MLVTRSRRFSAIFLLCALLSGCDSLSKLFDTVTDTTTKTVNVLNDAIDALENQSASWQAVLQDTMAKLTDDAQSTIRNEVNVVLSRSIAQAGVEFKCSADFIGDRVRQALIRIKAKLLNQSLPPIEPSLCHVVPIAVDRESVPQNVKQIEFYGYDFDHSRDLAVFLVRTAAGRTNVTNKLDRPTHYAMTLKFGGTGVQLDNRAERFVLEWGGREISTIAIVQPQTPVCESKLVKFPSAKVTYVPPKTRGDGDFVGHGPKVNTRVTLIATPQQLKTRVYMRAAETRSDYTTAEGMADFPLATPEALTGQTGWRIDRVVGPQVSTHGYTDANHTVDSFDLGSGGPVKRLDYVGDTSGSEAGTKTRVDVTFNELVVQVTKTANCVSATALQSIREAGLIRNEAFLRLQPQMLRELKSLKAIPR